MPAGQIKNAPGYVRQLPGVFRAAAPQIKADAFNPFIIQRQDLRVRNRQRSLNNVDKTRAQSLQGVNHKSLIKSLKRTGNNRAAAQPVVFVI